MVAAVLLVLLLLTAATPAPAAHSLRLDSCPVGAATLLLLLLLAPSLICRPL